MRSKIINVNVTNAQPHVRSFEDVLKEQGIVVHQQQPTSMKKSRPRKGKGEGVKHYGGNTSARNITPTPYANVSNKIDKIIDKRGYIEEVRKKSPFIEKLKRNKLTFAKIYDLPNGVAVFIKHRGK